MQIEVLRSKLHRATVTAAELDYEGSISIDTELLRAAEMHAYQKVDIYNINNGARFSTYIIPGRRGEICLNGAAARMAQVGDRIIIVTFTRIEESEADSWLPTVVLLGDGNEIKSAGRTGIEGGTVVGRQAQGAQAAAGEEGAMTAEERGIVLQLKRHGWGAAEIARRVRRSVPEVELVLEMSL